MHTFKLGDVVTIFNCTFNGTFIVEGNAVILRRIKDFDEQYRVRFLRDGKPSLGEEYERFVDPAGQADPVAYVRMLNYRTEEKTTEEAT